MTEVLIKNAGTGDIAEVTPNGRLKISAISEDIKDHSADSGIEQKYNINTGDITLTNDTKTSVLYLKNNSTEGDLICTLLVYNLGTTDGSGDVSIDILRNPNAGDIISNANNVQIGTGLEANQNFGSTNILVADIFKGASSETALSGGHGESIMTRSASSTGRIAISLGNMSLPKGTSLGVNYTPPSGNTSQIAQFAIACFLRTEDVDT